SLEGFNKNPHFDIRYWNTVFGRTRKIYEHYRAVLEGAVNDPGFRVKEEEVVRTRAILKEGIHRGEEERAKGIPGQDVKYDEVVPKQKSTSGRSKDYIIRDYPGGPINPKPK